MSTSISCSRRMTLLFCGVLPIGLLHSTAFSVAVAAYRRGSTPNVGLRTETVVGSTAGRAGIGRHAVPPTANSGSMPLVAGFTFTVEKRSHTGTSGCWAVVVPRRHRCSLSSLLGRDRQTSGDTDHTADGFATFFADRRRPVRHGGLPPPPAFFPASSSLASFRPCTESEVRRIVMSSPVKSSSLDPIPTFPVREFIDILLPYITKMVNS